MAGWRVVGENQPMSAEKATEHGDPGPSDSVPQLHVATVCRDDEAMVVLRGELDVATAPALAHELARGEVADARRVLIDLERLQFADLSGLDPLVEFALPVRPPLQVSFTPGPSAIQRLMSITGLDARLNLLTPAQAAAWS